MSIGSISIVKEINPGKPLRRFENETSKLSITRHCEENLPVIGGSSHKVPVMLSFDISLKKKRLNKRRVLDMVI